MTTGSDRSSKPWPYWMLRYVASNDPRAFSDLVWSVGGSPPYGKVNYEEAELVYKLLETFQGPGAASPALYDRVSERLGGRPDAVTALEVFRIHDRIASDPSAYTKEDVDAGLALAGELNHVGLTCYFLLLRAGLAHRNGDIDDAKSDTLDALTALVPLVAEDPVYLEQARKAAQNAASFCAMEGDLVRAKLAAEILRSLGAEQRLGSLRDRLLGAS
jgi:hypothetical protein